MTRSASRAAKATGEAVAFYDTGGPVLALFPWDKLAADAKLPDNPRPATFRGMTLAWNCATREEVDAVLAFAVGKGAALLKAAHETDYGGYSGYFADPDGHPWEVVVAPGIEVGEDRRVIWRIGGWLNNGNCPGFPVARRRACARSRP